MNLASIEISDGAAFLGLDDDVPADKDVDETEEPTMVENKEAMEEPLGFSEQDKDAGQRYFDRYDLDASGTLNSWEEAEMMTVNIVMALHLDIKSMNPPFQFTDDNALLDPIRHTDDNPMTFDEYWVYFSKTFQGVARKSD